MAQNAPPHPIGPVAKASPKRNPRFVDHSIGGAQPLARLAAHLAAALDCGFGCLAPHAALPWRTVSTARLRCWAMWNGSRTLGAHGTAR